MKGTSWGVDARGKMRTFKNGAEAKGGEGSGNKGKNGHYVISRATPSLHRTTVVCNHLNLRILRLPTHHAQREQRG